jgi:hypothetical protein
MVHDEGETAFAAAKGMDRAQVLYAGMALQASTPTSAPRHYSDARKRLSECQK